MNQRLDEINATLKAEDVQIAVLHAELDSQKAAMASLAATAA